ncbi:SusC/RagA family TonB-linked outer membrane protein [Aestuariibaculum sp. L182]|uniref:SusC/RagA family TonB-linked outer membrane protein n=3 Tax=Aestuariibaculum lutulentum TaxID=2920935 RepID=A0ABS9RJH8_9FLAO|nr:SusC/RagA family TonB-linked outer membrane protein [Aestuariibaculum lutulentum]
MQKLIKIRSHTRKRFLLMIMRTFIFLLCTAVFGISTNNSFAQDKVTISEDKLVSIDEVFDIINKQTHYHFMYPQELFENYPKVQIKKGEIDVFKLLSYSLGSKDFNVVLSTNNQIIIKPKEDGQQQFVSGRVLDVNGDPIYGVSVVIKGTKQGVSSDFDGNYAISVSSPENVLIFQALGFKMKEVLVGRSKRIDVTLEEDIEELDAVEIISTGIFNRPKTSFTGAASVITKEQIKSFGNRNLLRTLANIDPSLDIQEQNAFGSDPNNTTLSIEIRGAKSITDVSNLQNQSRGQLNTPLFLLDGFEVSVERVLDMNQNDVESVVILKDASATAIYGSRGANGVVVITSSNPPRGKLRVSYTSGLNFEIPNLSSYDLLDARQKLQIESIAGLYTGETVNEQILLDNLYNQNNKAVQEGVNTNWLKEPTQVGVGQYHSLRLGGGDKEFRYGFNVSYNGITGAMKGSKRDNVNASLNLQYQFKKVRFSNQLELGFNKGTNSPYGRFSDYYYMNPYWRPYDENGDPVMSYDTFNNQVKYNPLYDSSLASFSTTDYNNIRNQTAVSVNFNQNLKWDTSLGVTLLKGGSDYFSSPLNSSNFIAGIAPLDRGIYTQTFREERSYQISSTISYGKTFGKHMLYLGGNGQLIQNQNESTTLSVRGFTNEKLNDISNGISYTGQRPSRRESTVRSVGLTGTLNYNYDNRYFVEGSARLDGASSFGLESRYAPFYSFGAAWDLGQEKFIKENISKIDRIKFRYSYGVTGSLNFSAYQALSTYSYDTTSQYSNITGMTLLALGNPNLEWQNTKQHNFGLDFQAFDNRIGMTVNYYRINTHNLIGEASLPYSNGYTSYTENFGTVRNVGYDANLSVNVVRDLDNQFSWYVTTGVYSNKNTLVKLSDAIKEANEQWEGQNYSNGTFYQYREGESTDALYVLKSPGVDPLTGQVLYEDPETGNVYTSVQEGLRKISVGNTLPKINGRITSSLRYKGWMMDIGFSYRLGAKKLNNSLLRVENAYVANNMDARVLGTRWQQPGDITAFKSISSDESTYPNDRFVFTERAFALSSVNLSYQFPQKVLDYFKVKQLSLTSSISDVFYLSNISTERGTDYPYSIRPQLNLSVTF